ncbi:MAG TPA: NAD(P)H-dependent oxidoreductase subunit E [Anaerolineales bacterium]|nr:NAD(P)H-dependent oxidoreductase subunit E [Anaerolineales bacterium]
MTVLKHELDIRTVVQRAIEKHGSTRDALIPILSEVNREYGYIPAEALSEVRRQVRMSESQIIVSEGHLFSLASFYHMLSTKPLGQHVVRFCESAPCHVMGGRELLHAIQNTLGLQPGETSADGRWSFITTSCLGVCGVGPVILVDEDVYGNVTPADLPRILANYQEEVAV